MAGYWGGQVDWQERGGATGQKRLENVTTQVLAVPNYAGNLSITLWIPPAPSVFSYAYISTLQYTC